MSTLGNTRLAFIETLIELAEQDPKTVLVCADSVLVVKGREFARRFPDRFIDVGIAEQNAVNCAAGLAACGLVPYVATYAGFLTMRACEQVRTFVAYPGLNVKLVGANGGISAGEREGVTHQFFEDLGILRTIPGITVVVPADDIQVRQAARALHKLQGPAYLRIGSGRDPRADCQDIPFELGKIRILAEHGKDVALFTNGFVVNRALQAAERLAREGIRAVVADVHTLKPLDVPGIVSLLTQTGAAVTVEDHNIIGGLGSAVAECSAEECPAPVKRVGLPDCYPRSGTPEALLDYYHIGINDIVEAARAAVKKKKT
ncbi:MAG TPA: transketolase C-terminal domain-containing protein [Anaerohalosphaeraceae bacterium]|nr:transketolase C-terminal domain-containing protein [Anaerohalosphaeraceae bacterium]